MKVGPSSGTGRIRLCALIAILLAVAYFSNIQVLYYYLTYSPHEGDVVFQSLPHGELVDAIEGITHSPFSHCGVVLHEQNKWVVIEAIGDVHETPLLRWMQRGRKAAFSVYRFDKRYDPVMPEFKGYLHSYLGKPYDFDYNMSDDAIYCSELIYKAFLKTTGEKLGRLAKLKDLDWQPFQAFIKSMQADTVPLEREMITPVALSNASQLHCLKRDGM